MEYEKLIIVPISRLPRSRIASIHYFCVILVLITYHNVFCALPFFFFYKCARMTRYRQSGTLNFIKSYVLNNWEYIFFPHRKVKKEWCVFFFHLECWWHFSIHRRLSLILISVRETLENYTDFLCVVNFLIFVTL